MKTSINLFFSLLVLLFSASTYAQECDPKDPSSECSPSADFSGLPIDLLPPGARSLGLAGAFAGVADDATAAVANPAGLSILTAKEFSLHGRSSDSDVGFFDPDAYDSSFYAVPGELNKEYSDSGTNVSFASFVMPFDRWVVSAYYINQLDFQSEQLGGSDVVYDSGFIDTYTNDNSIDSGMDGYGLSASFRVTDSFSIGLTIQQSSLDLISVDRWQLDHFNDNEWFLAEQYGGTPAEWTDVVVDEQVTQTSIDDSDSDTNFSVGLMYSLNSNWSFGFVYREGAEFELDTLQDRTINFGCTGSGLMTEQCNEEFTSGSVTELGEDTTVIKVPDTISFGIGWRPTDTLLVSLDIKQVGYSDVTPVRSFTQGFGLNVNETLQLTEEIKDETTFHLGLEKVFVLQNNNTFSIRGGAFTIEDHDGNATVV